MSRNDLHSTVKYVNHSWTYDIKEHLNEYMIQESTIRFRLLIFIIRLFLYLYSSQLNTTQQIKIHD